mmetsp:Transcript_19815/g.41408  ORF Transcript_19815/g.41408 Transcript_19815/m.41408 type:complete len:269 (-) Transcript_19815:1968-2774(-)
MMPLIPMSNLAPSFTLASEPAEIQISSMLRISDTALAAKSMASRAALVRPLAASMPASAALYATSMAVSSASSFTTSGFRLATTLLAPSTVFSAASTAPLATSRAASAACLATHNAAILVSSQPLCVLQLTSYQCLQCFFSPSYLLISFCRPLTLFSASFSLDFSSLSLFSASVNLSSSSFFSSSIFFLLLSSSGFFFSSHSVSFSFASSSFLSADSLASFSLFTTVVPIQSSSFCWMDAYRLKSDGCFRPGAFSWNWTSKMPSVYMM